MNYTKINFKLKVILVSVTMVFLYTMGYANKIAELPNVLKPFFITIGHNKLYIGEYGSKIHIFDLINNKIKYVKAFGTIGEGPGEFQFVHRLSARDNCLEIPTYGKYARFTFNGKLIDEIKLPFRVFKNNIFKIGGNYLTRSSDFNKNAKHIKIKLWNHELKLIKEMEKNTRRFEPGRMNFFSAFISCLVVGKNIYIIKSDRETIVKKYDQNGKYINKIKLSLNPIKIDPRIKKKISEELTEGLKGEELKFFKKGLYFPDFTPGLNYFNISNNKIITRTFQFNKNKVEFVFFDMKGKELKRMYLHDTGRTSSGIKFYFYEDTFYYIKENEDKEIWELFAVKVSN